MAFITASSQRSCPVFFATTFSAPSRGSPSGLDHFLSERNNISIARPEPQPFLSASCKFTQGRLFIPQRSHRRILTHHLSASGVSANGSKTKFAAVCCSLSQPPQRLTAPNTDFIRHRFSCKREDECCCDLSATAMLLLPRSQSLDRCVRDGWVSWRSLRSAAPGLLPPPDPILFVQDLTAPACSALSVGSTEDTLHTRIPERIYLEVQFCQTVVREDNAAPIAAAPAVAIRFLRHKLREAVAPPLA